MRIAFFSNVHPTPIAAQKGTFNGALVRALGAAHDVHVISPVSWVDRCRAWRRNIPAAPVTLQPRVTASFPTFWYPPTLCRSQFDRFLEWSLRGRVLRELRDFQPDAMLSYWAHPDGTCAVRLARSLKIPAVTMVGGSDILLLGRHGRRRRIIRQTLEASDAVIAVSEDIRQQIVADGVAPGRVHVVRRGVDRDVFHPHDRAAARARLNLCASEKLVVGVGRLVPVKDWPTLIHAWGHVGQNRAPARCVILGDGPERPRLQHLIEQLGLQDQIELAGGKSQSTLADWYRAADLLALPSLSEGIPNVLLEGIACGAPFVATRVGGIPEIADPVQHRLVPPGQPQALAAAITDLLQRGRPTRMPCCEPLTWQQSANRVVQILQGCREAEVPAEPHETFDSTEFATESPGRDMALVTSTTLTEGR